MSFGHHFRSLLECDSSMKFLGTLDDHGTPNVVPILSLEPWDCETVIFGECVMYKSKRNLQELPRAGLLAIDNQLRFAGAIADFGGFERSGPYMERLGLLFAEKCPPCLAHTEIRRAGWLKARGELGEGQLQWKSSFRSLVGLHFTGARAKDATAMPLPAFDFLNQRSAIKVIAFRGPGGYPELWPAMPLIAPDRRTLLLSTKTLAHRPVSGQTVAICVLTRDSISYQIKGTYEPLGGQKAQVAVAEVYTACPPLCGEKIAG